jgi:hypothetical protein
VPVDDGGGWDGLPPDPSADGWHDLGYRRGLVTARWRAALRRWDLGAGLACRAEVARLASCGGPAAALCILPAEREGSLHGLPKIAR